MMNSMGSVYFDAYAGEQEMDQIIAINNKIIEDKTNITQDGRNLKRTQGKEQYRQSQSPSVNRGRNSLLKQAGVSPDVIQEESGSSTQNLTKSNGEITKDAYNNDESEGLIETLISLDDADQEYAQPKKKGCCCLIF